MGDTKQVRCHQFLGGRFHEGYGRLELSRTAGRGGQVTIQYPMINMEGRNQHVRDGYSVFEVVSTHAEKKCPGVFHITNSIVGGTGTARTYGVVPEDGSIDSAFSVLK